MNDLEKFKKLTKTEMKSVLGGKSLDDICANGGTPACHKFCMENLQVEGVCIENNCNCIV